MEFSYISHKKSDFRSDFLASMEMRDSCISGFHPSVLEEPSTSFESDRSMASRSKILFFATKSL